MSAVYEESACYCYGEPSIRGHSKAHPRNRFTHTLMLILLKLARSYITVSCWKAILTKLFILMGQSLRTRLNLYPGSVFRLPLRGTAWSTVCSFSVRKIIRFLVLISIFLSRTPC